MRMTLVEFLVLISVAAVSYYMTIYKSLLRVKSNIDKTWMHINALIKQRRDEITKLLNICKGSMALESGLLTELIQANQRVIEAQNPTTMGQAEEALQASKRRLLALVDNDPNLKAQSSFQQMNERVSAVDSQIADQRVLYNDLVHSYTHRLESIPAALLSVMKQLEPRESYRVDQVK